MDIEMFLNSELTNTPDKIIRKKFGTMMFDELYLLDDFLRENSKFDKNFTKTKKYKRFFKDYQIKYRENLQQIDDAWNKQVNNTTNENYGYKYIDYKQLLFNSPDIPNALKRDNKVLENNHQIIGDVRKNDLRVEEVRFNDSKYNSLKDIFNKTYDDVTYISKIKI